MSAKTTKGLNILLITIFVIILVGFTLTACLLAVNEQEIALQFVTVTSYIALPLLIVAIIIDLKTN